MSLQLPHLRLQAAPSPAPPVRLEDLTVQESAALRCSVAFAYVSDWQKDGDARGAAWPGLEAQGGREFFVRTMAQLMGRRGLDRRGVFDLIALQTERLKAIRKGGHDARLPADEVRRRAVSADISPAAAPCGAGFRAPSAALKQVQCGFSINSRSARSAARSGCF